MTDSTTGGASVGGLEARHLRQLVAVADHGDLHAAARDLGVPVERLARRLSALETFVRAPLFEPGPTGLVPTARGARVVHAARSVLADLAQLTGTSVPTAVLRLVGVDALLAPMLRELAKARPDLRLESRTASAAAAVADVQSAAADVAVAIRWPHVPWPSAVGERRVERRPLQLLVPDVHPLAGRTVVDLAELAGDAWCLPTDPDCSAAITSECARAGLEPDTRYRVSGEAELCDLVAAGRAVALTAHPPRSGDRLVRLAYRGASVVEWIVVAGPRTGSADVAAVVAALERVASPQPSTPAEGGDVGLGTAAHPLRIAAGPGVAVPAPLVGPARLHVRVVEREEVQLVDAIDAGEADLALHHSYFLLPGPLPASWMRRVVGLDEQLLVAMAPGRATGPLPVEELCRLRWAVPTTPTVQAVVRALCRLGGGDADVAVVYEDPRDVASAVARGEVVRLADPAEPAAGAVRVPIDHWTARRSTVLTWLPGRPLATVADVVARQLGRDTAPWTPVRIAG